MKIIWTLLWAFLLSSMTAYVVSNMTGSGFQLSQIVVLTVLFTGAVIALGEGAITKEEA